MADLLEDLLPQEGAEDGGPLRRARGTESSPSAGECHQLLGPARVAVDAGESALEVTVAWKAGTTALKGQDHLIDRAAPVAVGALESLLPGALDLLVALVDEAIQRRVSRSTWSIECCTGRQKQGSPYFRETASSRPSFCLGASDRGEG